MIGTAKKSLYTSYRITKSYLKDLKKRYYYQYFPPKPSVINFLANDICNSKCVMCNIWEQKKDIEITPKQLESILKDKLFTNILHVGVTGGEPTLRDDLPQLYSVISKTLPNLQYASIITNAIKSEEVLERILAANSECQNHGVKFSVMVSLDGYGKIHDKNRRRSGNFDSALHVLNYLKSHSEIPVSVGCTITKENVWGIDELLDFLIENDFYGRFRIAEFIDRLYNNDLQDQIRCFNEEESYHLACFFKRLELSFEKRKKYQRTYKSIQHMLLGGNRIIGCPYQTDGVVLDSRGNIQYCAPKSRTIGSALLDSSMKIFKNNIHERRKIISENCSTCIHDYHSDITTYEIIQEAKEEFGELAFSFSGSQKIAKVAPFIKWCTKRNTKNQIFITGWYGTETVGDKAILGAILDFYDNYFKGEVSFIISAFYTFITRQTLKELNKEAVVVPVDSIEFFKAAANSDITIMGGGPLMDLKALSVPLSAFRIAQKAKRKTVVFGCGLGPLYKKKFINAVQEILNIATEIKLRDSKSVKWAKELTNREDIELIGDPASVYLSKFKNNKSEQKNRLSCFLREWSKEYIGELSSEEFGNIKQQYESKLAATIINFCKSNNLIPYFYSMHTFSVGGDDRTFYRRFTKQYFTEIEYYIEDKPSSVEQIATAMSTSKYNLCMRFHSVLFANTLDANFFAIDYTNGGKITGYLTDHHKTHKMIKLIEFTKSEITSLDEFFKY